MLISEWARSFRRYATKYVSVLTNAQLSANNDELLQSSLHREELLAGCALFPSSTEIIRNASGDSLLETIDYMVQKYGASGDHFVRTKKPEVTTRTNKPPTTNTNTKKTVNVTSKKATACPCAFCGDPSHNRTECEGWENWVQKKKDSGEWQEKWQPEESKN